MIDKTNIRGAARKASLSARFVTGRPKSLHFLLAALVAPAVFAQIQFQDVTVGSGITHVGESYGAAWGDLNADGWPDLYVSNHRTQRSLYVNNSDGTFTDRARDVLLWRAFPTADTHGAGWGDFNHDGYQDLFTTVGARDNQEFFINEGGALVDSLDPKYNHKYDNVNYRGWEGRLPMWLDFNNDGMMDFFMMMRGSPKIFQQDVTGFIPMNIQTGIQCSNSQFGQMADLTGSGRLELICDDHKLWPSKIYDTTTLPFTNVSSIMPQTVAVSDSVLADFDGNLRTDLFLLIGAERISEAALVNGSRIEAQTIVDGAKEKGFSVQTDGVITIELHWTQRNLSRLFIGATGWHPSGIGPTDLITFSLNPADSTVWGIKARDPASDNGIYIGYDPATMRWTIAVSPGGGSTVPALQQTYWFINTTTSFSALAQNIPGADLPIRPVLRMNTGTDFPNQAQTRGVGDLMQCVSAVAGDFDNDMDQDIYAVCRGGVTNLENRLYENQGDGTFVRVSLAGGAAGPTGVGVGVGVGENVVTADYDVDGFLDLFVTNGLNMLPEAPYVSRGGADMLFHNVANTNHWIELDLIGTTSNSDGVGAKIYATAGGITQLREQNGGYHRWAQNHQRVHFGLANNGLVNLRIEWPSGVVDSYTNVSANNLYKVTENGGYMPFTPAINSPSSCNMPTYSAGTEAAVFVWKNCSTGVWSMRVTGGGSSSGMAYSGRVISNQPFSTLTPVSVEGNDTLKFLDPNNTEIDYSFTTTLTYQDGFDFSLPSNTTACFKVDAPAGVIVYVGGARTQVDTAFDMATLHPCPTPG